MTAALEQGYQERPVHFGALSDGSPVLLLVGPAGETWTILVVRPHPSGPVACIAATGTAWQSLPAVPEGDPS